MCESCCRSVPVRELVDDDGIPAGTFCEDCVPQAELVLAGPYSVFEDPFPRD